MTAPILAQQTDHGRYYFHPSRASSVPSITNIKGVKNIPALKYWGPKECATYAADNIAKLATLDRDEIFQLVKGAPFARSSAREAASKTGDIVHDWIDRTIKGETITDFTTWTDSNGYGTQVPLQARQMWRQFTGAGDQPGFLGTYRPRWVASEFSVWSDKHGYAGTADWAAYINGSLVLGDNKTGNNAYPDVAIQLAALANADFIIEPDGTEKPLPAFDRFAVLHLRPRGFRLHPVEHIGEAFKAFLGLKAVFDWMINYEDSTLAYAPKIEVRAA